MSIKPVLSAQDSFHVNNESYTYKQALNSKEVSIICACNLSTVQKNTKKALLSGLKVININNSSFMFETIKTKSGKAYTYTQIKSSKIRTKTAKTIGFAILKELEGFDITKTKHSPDEKALIIDKNIYPDPIKIASMVKKVKRWCETFKTKGAKALEDKRGYKSTNLKIDEELLSLAVTGAGSRGIRDNYYGAWEFYNYLKAKQEGILDCPKFALADTKTTKLINGVKSYISYSAFVLAVKRLYNKNPQIKSYMKYGKDALLQDYVVGIKDVGYINQEWQVDSTKFDFMCKIPTSTGYKIGRVNLTAVIDVYSKKAVVSLSETIDSYAQVRVLNKAFATFGMPESIYTDNGRDYTSKHYSGVLQELGITHLKAKVGQGRQKGAIERFFGVTQSSWAGLPGYIGENVEKRVKIENQSASKIDVRTSKATRINKDRLLTLDELKEAVYTLLHMKNITYSEFSEFRLSPEKLEFIKSKLGKTKEATLQTSGVRFNNFIYQSAALWLGGLNRGDKVEVYEDIDNINEVYIYKDDSFICKALNKELGVEAMSIEEHKKTVRAYKQNNINPISKTIKKAQILYEEFQDYKLEKTLKNKAQYQDTKTKSKIGVKIGKTIKQEDLKLQNELYLLSQKFA